MKKILLAIILVAILFALSCGGEKIVQPIQFNHKLHTVDNELECDFCHTMYATQHTSGRPMIETCSMCHSDAQGDSPEEAKLIENYVTPGIEPPWQRVFSTRNDVYYSHRRHVVLGGLECTECHGDVMNMTTPPSKPFVMSMEECIACHREKKVTEDCLACHK